MQNDTADSAPSGSNKKGTVYVAGLASEVNEDQLLAAFITFGDILDIKVPHEVQDPTKHRGFAFITFSHPSDAQDAIDNFDLNELPGYQGRGKFLKCSLANPNRFASEGGSGGKFDKAIWSTDEYQAAHGDKPRDELVEEAQLAQK
ncbi:uncharacterized protein IL334_003155 [Kwoniella shivajii]|uniref:RRM domain-containing protein n=1 Tax=Kwoniella shivajii TaxID=564305 RepID=A0ABZ1CWR6_9TREE|nr:hypothetical protein IL334_003155 [Kwoniella shivajii]